MSGLSELRADWPAISRLLDDALDQPEPQRQAWIDGLQGESAAVKDSLRRLLAAPAEVETGAMRLTLPRLGVAGPGPGPGPGSGFGSGLGEKLTEGLADSAEVALGETVGPWRLLAPLGEGGMASVWLAERADGSLRRQVALKLPRLSWARGLAERLAREREILATLEHPRIARLYDAGVDALGRPWLALERVQGRAIDEHARDKGLTVRQRVELLLQVCEAVAYAHSRLVVHRDLKPSNILVTDDGQVKLLDFGIAKLTESGGGESALTVLAGAALTPEYASPEQVRGEALGTASDVYSLGVVAYELLSGSKPYLLKRGSAAELKEAIAEVDIPPASRRAPTPAVRLALRGDLDAILNRALKGLAAERYPTVDALAQDLSRHLQHLPVSARPDGLAYRGARWVRRHRLPTGIALGVGIALIGGAYAQALVALALGAGAALALWQRNEALRQRDVATEERRRADRAAEQTRQEAERAFSALEQADAVNDFMTTLLGEVGTDEPLTAPQLVARAEALVTLEDGEGRRRAAVQRVLAQQYSSFGNFAKAGLLADSAVALARQSGDRLLLGQMLCAQASIAGRRGQSSGAARTLERLAVDYADVPQLAFECLTARAYLAQNDNDAKAATLFAEQALARLRQVPRRVLRSEAAAVSNLAYGHSLAGRTDEAMKLFAQAIGLYREVGAEECASALTVWNNWALAALTASQPLQALALLDRAADIAARRSPDGHPPCYLLCNRARLLAGLHRLDEALAVANQACAAARHAGGPEARVAAEIARSDALRRRGDPQAARAVLDEIESDLAGQLPPGGPASLNLLRLHTLLNIADGRLDEALSGINEAIGAMQARGFAGASLASAYSDRAEILRLQEQPLAARTDLEHALQLARRAQGALPHGAEAGRVLRRLSQVQRDLGEHEAARSNLIQALENLTATLGTAHPEAELARQQHAAALQGSPAAA